jgi:AcrR family transcriptional regulator
MTCHLGIVGRVNSTHQGVGWREEKKQRTRDRLVEAAFSLFDERGYENVSTAEIAAQAEVSERTFFRYFPTKEEVIFPDTEEQRRHVDELVSNLPDTMSLVEGLREALRTLSHEFEQAKELQFARARLVASTPSLQTSVLLREQQWVQSFADAIAARLDLDPKADMRPELTAAVIVSAFRVVMSRWIQSGGRGDINQMLDQALAYVGTGLSSTS